MLPSSVPPRLCQCSNRPSHRLVRHLDKPIHHLIQTQLRIFLMPALRMDTLVDFLRHLLKRCPRCIHIQWLLFTLAKDLWEEIRDEAPEEEVRVGDRERSAFAVAGGSRVSPCALGASQEEAVAEGEAAAASSGDGVDVELWTLDCHTSSGCFVYNFVAAIETRDVCGGSANIESGASMRKQ